MLDEIKLWPQSRPQIARNVWVAAVIKTPVVDTTDSPSQRLSVMVTLLENSLFIPAFEVRNSGFCTLDLYSGYQQFICPNGEQEHTVIQEDFQVFGRKLLTSYWSVMVIPGTPS